METALVMPVFLLLVFGLTSFSMVMFGMCNIAYASHCAVRYACLHSATSSVPTTMVTMNNLISPYIYAYPNNTYATSLIYSGTGNQIGNTVRVSVTLTYNIVSPFFSYSGLNLTSSASGIIIQ